MNNFKKRKVMWTYYYIVNSTRLEIEYVMKLKKEIIYYTDFNQDKLDKYEIYLNFANNS